jgi:hypothetical protein
MASQIVKPNYSSEDAAWLAAYVALNGPISVSVGGHAATVAANGWITLEDRPVKVEAEIALPMTAAEIAAVKKSAPSWVASWRAIGAAG